MIIKVRQEEKTPEIIKSARPLPSLLSAKVEDDNFHFVHTQNVEPILESCHEQRKENDPRQFNLNEWEKIATIPEIEYLKHPEWNHDPEALTKWLKSDEGKQYRVSRRRI
jgi:hypothetical protein